MRVVRAAIIAAAVLGSSTQAFAYRICAWIPPWSQNALTTIQMNGGAIDESNPVWYSWNADASIAKNWNAENPTWRAAMTGSALMPTIQNIVSGSFDGNAAATMLATSASRDAHASAIAQLVINNAFDGIDVDYERIPAASRANFSAFIASLAGKLHVAEKKLSVTVYAKTSDSETWTGAGAEDWVAIGAVADSVKLMVYDYHWSTSPAGDITPLSWLDNVVTYAESAIPRTKIIAGLPWYGYDWSNGTGATATYASAMQVALNNGATVTHDADGEATYTYGDHVVYFNDATSYRAAMNLLKSKHSGIAGVAHWSAGQEDPAVWDIIKATPAQAAPADFTVMGPSTLTLMQGQSASGAFRLVPINAFTGTASISIIGTSAFNGTVAPSASTVAPSSSVTLNIATSAATQSGTYAMTVRFTSGTLVHDVPLTIVIDRAPKHRAAGR